MKYSKKTLANEVERVCLLIVFVLMGVLVLRGLFEDRGLTAEDFWAEAAPTDEGAFPRILWVQTDHELEAKAMEEAIIGQNLIHFGKQGGFEVRVVNSLNAYDWLSDEMAAFVKDTHQKSKVELNVFELLRLALLYEHGGVAVLLPNILLMEGLGWVGEAMRGGSGLSRADRRAFSCGLPTADVLMFHEGVGSSIWYKEDFVAAKPKATLFKVLMSMTAKIVK